MTELQSGALHQGQRIAVTPTFLTSPWPLPFSLSCYWTPLFSLSETFSVSPSTSSPSQSAANHLTRLPPITVAFTVAVTLWPWRCRWGPRMTPPPLIHGAITFVSLPFSCHQLCILGLSPAAAAGCNIVVVSVKVILTFPLQSPLCC